MRAAYAPMLNLNVASVRGGVPEAVEHWSLTTLREKLIKIDAKVVRHGR